MIARSRARLLGTVALAALAAAPAQLGAGNPAPIRASAVAPLTKAEARHAYLAAASPVNTAQSAFSARARQWGPTTSEAVARREALHFLKALSVAELRLAAIEAGFPAAVAPLHADVRAAAAVADAVDALAAGRSAAAWSRYLAGRQRLIAASNGVRAALGLPQTRR